MRIAKRVLRGLDEFCSARPRLCFAIVSLVYFGGECLKAARKPFWFDELATFYMSRRGAGSVWGSLQRIDEVHPPLSFWLTAISQHVFGPGELATRAPVIAAFWASCAALFLLVKNRLSASHGFAAILLLALSGSEYYATEARPYALVLASAAFSLWFLHLWREKGGIASLAGLCTALAAAISSHYLAVLTLIPLAAGQMVMDWRARKIDFPVWISLACSLAPLAFYWPLLRSIKEVYATHNRNPATLAAVIECYWRLIGPIALILVVILILAMREGRRREEAHNLVTAAAFALLPFIALAAGRWTNSLHPRYVIAMASGVILLTLYQANRTMGALCLLIALAVWTANVSIHIARSLNHGATTSGVALPQPGGPAFPIVVDSPLQFFPMAHYASSVERARLHYIASPADSIRTAGSDTMDQNLLRLRLIAPIQVDPYPGLLGQSGALFLLYVNRLYPDGWLLAKVAQAGAHIEARPPLDNETAVYLIQMP